PAYCGAVFCKDGTSDCDFDKMTCNPIIIKPTDPLFINVVAYDQNGCESETMLNVKVTKDRKILVPTGFTPNKDGRNDLLLVHGKSGTEVLSFQVFDRWGELVWEGGNFMVNQTTIGWDGTFKGQDVPAGMYIWHLTVRFVDGRTEALTGNTTLIR
ncbi:MAG: gliding motility-associated C-terminal domain-containing protein, partial [Bacteroidetes bacterium]